MRYTRTLSVLAVVVGAFFATFIGTASAATQKASDNCTTDSNGVRYCNEQSQMDIAQSDTKVESLNVTSGGTLQLKFVMSNGLPKAKQHNCRNVIGGTNSYYDSHGNLIKIPWTGKPARVCVDKSSPSGYRKVGPTNCGNPFWPPFIRQPKNIYLGKYKVVQNFTYNVRMSLKLTLTGHVNATASCSVGGASASGTASGTDTMSIVVTGTGSGRTMVEATGKAQAVALNSTEVNDLKGKVNANASFKMHVSASAWCQASPPQPPATCQDHNANNYGGALPCTYNQPPAKCTDTKATNYGGPLPCTYPPPPPANRPPTGNLVVPQHVYVNGVADVCVDGVSDPDGDPVTISFSFTAGSAVSAVFTQPSGARCVQYKAPSTPQQVTVTATISDNRGGSVTRLDNFPIVPDQF